MDRRALLGAAGAALTGSLAGCLDAVPGLRLDVEFERTEAELAVDEPPVVTVDGGQIVVRGTLRHASDDCGAVELAHATHERSQNRVDFLVVAADDAGLGLSCHDDVVEAGYRIEASVRGGVRRATATEHHLFGDAYSTTAHASEG